MVDEEAIEVVEDGKIGVDTPEDTVLDNETVLLDCAPDVADEELLDDPENEEEELLVPEDMEEKLEVPVVGEEDADDDPTA